MNTSTTVPATADPILAVENLEVDFYVEGQWYPAAVGVSYHVAPGEVLAIVGESGSGKTQSSMALMGLLPANGRSTGSAKLLGTELIGASSATLQRIRGDEIAMIFQEPMTALNPVYTIGFQIVETLRAHRDIGPAEAKARAIELLKLVDMPDPERRFDAYPHQLSGGQRQRAMIAQSLSCDPKLLIADEPTTALDVTVQAEILKLMRDLRTRIDAGIVLITHDMGVVADLADRIMVMRRGHVVEAGTVREVFANPRHAYTQELLGAVPHLGEGRIDVSEPGAQAPGSVTSSSGPALVAQNLVIDYPGTRRGPTFRAIDNLSLTIGAGEVVGLVGESGSGKTTIGRAVVGLLPVTSGSLHVAGTDVRRAGASAWRKIRQEIGIVFQDPGSSLNPRLPIGESIGEPLFLNKGLRGQELSRRVESLLDQVQLPRSMRNRYPHELSGGQRQRVGIARALGLQPKLLVADEPTAALDVSVQAKVLEMFTELQREHGFACLFISHDLAVVELLADRVAVLHRGKLVEVGETEQVIHHPRDPYTQRLIAAVPVPDPGRQAERRAVRDELIDQHLEDTDPELAEAEVLDPSARPDDPRA